MRLRPRWPASVVAFWDHLLEASEYGLARLFRRRKPAARKPLFARKHADFERLERRELPAAFFNIGNTMEVVEGATAGLISITLYDTTTELSGPYSVDYKTEDGSGESGTEGDDDYAEVDDTWNYVGNGTTLQDWRVFTITTVDDDLYEGPETFTVRIENASGASLQVGATTITITILDND